MARWRRDDPDRYEAAQRACTLRSYGLSIEGFNVLLQRQGHVCAICCRPESRGWDLSVDHDHVTGAVRGLLCRRCNLGIGFLGDDARLVMAAARYLKAQTTK